MIRNVVTKNCDVGIKLRTSAVGIQAGYTEPNHIEHVRMENVGKGIVFEKDQYGAQDFPFTYINDVGISLSDAANCTGIEIGLGCALYSSYIKANVWLTNATNNTGMDVQGSLTKGLVNLYVSNISGELSRGKGINIGRGGEVDKNQEKVFLTAFRLNQSSIPENPDDITIVPLT